MSAAGELISGYWSLDPGEITRSREERWRRELLAQVIVALAQLAPFRGSNFRGNGFGYLVGSADGRSFRFRRCVALWAPVRCWG